MTGVARRVGQMVVTVLVSSFATFAFLHLSPGDPVQIILGNQAGNRAAATRIRHEFGLDKPFLVQYWDWLSGMVHGDFGTSYLFRDSVGSLMASRLPTTLLLVALGSLMVIVVGFALGLLAARAHRRVDQAISTLLAISLATPSYVAAIGLITIFSMDLHWFPVLGSGTGLLDRLHHLVLPAVSLALAASAGMARVTRAAILEEGRRDHVTTAVARGLPPREVLTRHVVRNAMLPITTNIGIIVASLIAGTVIVDQAYGLDGLGSLLVLAIQRKDYPVVLSVSFLIIVAFLVVNAVVDVCYGLLDPRTRARP